jgi:hypothetical protein
MAMRILVAAVIAAAAAAGAEEKMAAGAQKVVGWVSDGHCGAKHMKTGGAACVRKCIAGAEHVNAQFKPGGMVFVTEDKQVWKVDNPDALWGHESQQLEVMATRDTEKKSIKVDRIVEVRQK